MWQQKQTELLTRELEAILAPLSGMGELYELIKEPMAVSRRGFSSKAAHDRPWHLLTLMVCEAISGDYEVALPAAASTQLLMVAGDVFDDVEDADSDESLSARYGSAVAVNAATALLIMAERGILRLKTGGLGGDVILNVYDAVNSCYTTACCGQHMDLSPVSGDAVSENDYLRMTSMKSASQIECASRVGAILATENRELIEDFTQFGQNLGMASQISNDILGAKNGKDILKKKMTLPVIYALTQADDETRDYLKRIFTGHDETVPDVAKTRDLLFSSGAMYYTMLKMEYFRVCARDNLEKAKEKGAATDKLELFIK